jgi:tetratricopeptide (TPR) repeat protein
MNLGVAQKRLGLFDQALHNMLESLSLDYHVAQTHLNLGTVYTDLADMSNAKKHLLIATSKDPKLVKAYWNLCATADTTEEAEKLIDHILVIDPHYPLAIMYKAGLRAIHDDFSALMEVRTTNLANHAYTRSFEWYLALGYQPPIFFNRWALFDYLQTLAETSRPFYEFGVWTGAAFRYLIQTYKKGFGFDTFSGLPEDWHGEAKGSYSAQGVVPRIDGGEFIVGTFEDTLPSFFSEPRPAASLINFDADLYSSTICALENCHPVIDDITILVFDEFIMNTNWEQDEYKALEEFCQRYEYSYKVIAVSFYEKQVAVQLVKERDTSQPKT